MGRALVPWEDPLLRWMLALDTLVARSRVAWWWLGQLGIVLIGVHLAADRLDDGVTALLTNSGIPWPEPDQPLTLGTWTAVLIELYVAAWVVVTAARATAPACLSARAWAERATVHAVAAPVLWLPAMLAGAWMIGMSAEDAVAEYWAAGAAPIGWIAAILVVVRLGWPGLARIVMQTPVPLHRWDGALTAWPAVLVAGLALRYGLPIWGWLP